MNNLEGKDHDTYSAQVYSGIIPQLLTVLPGITVAMNFSHFLQATYDWFSLCAWKTDFSHCDVLLLPTKGTVFCYSLFL